MPETFLRRMQRTAEQPVRTRPRLNGEGVEPLCEVTQGDLTLLIGMARLGRPISTPGIEALIQRHVSIDANCQLTGIQVAATAIQNEITPDDPPTMPG